jgi:pyruvate/2-oxoglutarate dehydrogenase complex dihydrolipoamide acyltransferase (E2) component
MSPVAEPRQVPLSRMRRGIVRAMNASAQVPQFTVEMEMRANPLRERRERAVAESGRLSYSDALTAACAAALLEHPRVNASFAEDAIVEHAEVNVGLAVALEDGLIAPAVRNADRLTLAEIEAERVRLTEAAQAGTLSAEEVLAATFTISNLGPFGVTRFQALVVPPQAAILAVGALTAEGRIALALSCDHRVLDGAPAARFLGDVVDRLHDPSWLEDLL